MSRLIGLLLVSDTAGFGDALARLSVALGSLLNACTDLSFAAVGILGAAVDELAAGGTVSFAGGTALTLADASAAGDALVACGFSALTGVAAAGLDLSSRPF